MRSLTGLTDVCHQCPQLCLCHNAGNVKSFVACAQPLQEGCGCRSGWWWSGCVSLQRWVIAAMN